jgi:hypothetical protein
MTAGSHVSWADGREPVQANGEFDQKQAEERASPGGLSGFNRIVLVEHDNMHFSATALVRNGDAHLQSTGSILPHDATEAHHTARARDRAKRMCKRPVRFDD